MQLVPLPAGAPGEHALLAEGCGEPVSGAFGKFQRLGEVFKGEGWLLFREEEEEIDAALQGLESFCGQSGVSLCAISHLHSPSIIVAAGLSRPFWTLLVRTGEHPLRSVSPVGYEVFARRSMAWRRCRSMALHARGMSRASRAFRICSCSTSDSQANPPRRACMMIR